MMKNLSFKQTMGLGVRVTIAVFVCALAVMMVIQTLPITIIMVGGMLSIPAQVVLTSADFYVWLLTGMFIVGIALYITVKLIPYIWVKILTVGRERNENNDNNENVEVINAKSKTTKRKK